MFADLRGSTAISEQLSAPQVVAFLNEFVGAMAGAVFAQGGRHFHYHLERIRLAIADPGLELHRAGAAARRFPGGSHDARHGFVRPVQLERDRLRRIGQAAVVLPL